MHALYKNLQRSTLTKGRVAIILVVVAAVMFPLGFMLRFSQEPPIRATMEGPQSATAAIGPEGAPASLESASKQLALTPPSEHTEVGEVPNGASASTLLNHVLGVREIHDLAQACKDVHKLSRIRAGRPYSITTRAGTFVSFVYEIDDSEQLVVTKNDKGEGAAAFHAELVPIEYEVVPHSVEGSIESSLFLAMDRAGEGAELAYGLFRMFAWEIDFIRDIRKGDRFKAIFEKRYRDGKFSGYGRILAASFENQGQMYEGFLHEDDAGRRDYYDAQGRNLRKAFLKAPLAFKRISSNFTRKRLHPVLKVYRPHPGIDFAAPTGTPVKASCDGTVTKVLRNKASGRYVAVRHPNGYESYYLHLSGFARGLRKGAKVRQGQVIGYVGMTGYATGPHLDYRIKFQGRWINPLKIKNPRASALAKEELAAFQSKVAEFRSRLAMDVAQAEAKAELAL